MWFLLLVPTILCCAYLLWHVWRLADSLFVTVDGPDTLGPPPEQPEPTPPPRSIPGGEPDFDALESWLSSQTPLTISR